MKKRQSTEYEVLELDEYGDIQELYFFDKKSEAFEFYDECDFEYKEVWKVRWSYVDHGDFTDEGDRESEVKIR